MGNNLNFNLKVYSPSKPDSIAKPMVSNLVYYDIPDYHGKNTFISNSSRDNADIIDLNSFTEEDSSSKNETGANFGDVCLSFVGSLVGEFLNLGEGFVDSHIYGTTKTINATYLDKAFGWENGYDDNIIGYDVSGIVKDAIQGDSQDKKDNWWVEKADGVGSFVGEMVGYGALNSIPYVGFLASIFAGAGRKTEESINEQMTDTGCVNDWSVFFKSLGGSLEGFAFSRGWKAKNVIQNGGIKKVFSGAAKLSTSNLNTTGKGLVKVWNVGKSVVVNWVKTMPTVAKNAGLSALKDSKSWAQTGANIIDDVMTIFQSKDFESWSHIIAPNGWKYFGDNLGYSGMSYLKDLID